MKRVAFALSLVLAFTLTSCEKDISGCTDPDSTNYNSEANVNDNSCAYEGSMGFWYSEDCADVFGYYEVTSLKFYIDGELIGSKSADTYYASSPGCDAAETVPTTQDLGSVKDKDFNLLVVDEDGDTVWDAEVTFSGNKCITMQLTFEAMYPYLTLKKAR